MHELMNSSKTFNRTERLVMEFVVLLDCWLSEFVMQSLRELIVIRKRLKLLVQLSHLPAKLLTALKLVITLWWEHSNIYYFMILSSLWNFHYAKLKLLKYRPHIKWIFIYLLLWWILFSKLLTGRTLLNLLERILY